MSVEQKVILARVSTPAQATRLAETLNEEAAEGWRLQHISTTASRGGGAMYSIPGAYYFDQHLVTLKRGTGNYCYECALQVRRPKIETDLELINAKVCEMNAHGYELVQTLQAISLNTDADRPTVGTSAYVLVFEREEE